MQRLKTASPCLDLMNSPVKLLFRQIDQISYTFTATANINRQVRDGRRYYIFWRRQDSSPSPHPVHLTSLKSAPQPVIETKTFVCCSPTTFKLNWKIISQSGNTGNTIHTCMGYRVWLSKLTYISNNLTYICLVIYFYMLQTKKSDTLSDWLASIQHLAHI